MDQERSEIPISALADPTDMFPAAARGDAWRQSEPGSEMARRLELGAVSDRSDQSRRGQWPHARRGRETLALLAGLVLGEDLPLHRVELHGQCVEVIEQGRESCARFVREDALARLLHAAPELADGWMPLGATSPNSPSSPRAELTAAVRCRTRSDRTR